MSNKYVITSVTSTTISELVAGITTSIFPNYSTVSTTWPISYSLREVYIYHLLGLWGYEVDLL